MDDLGDRMKKYEMAETGRRLLPLVPIYARIDGRSFSSFTKGMDRPFDPDMSEAMIKTTCKLVEKTHARIGYTQSDEISLVWLQEDFKGEVFFTGKVQKMVSVLSSLATAAFIQALSKTRYADRLSRLPHFDARVFSLPSKAEAANAFLWREMDATKNAISMAARAYYPHRELEGKKSGELQEMLFAAGVNFNDYPAHLKRGTFVRRETQHRELTADDLAAIPIAYRPQAGHRVSRFNMVRLEMPRFGSVQNREAVIFDGAEPIVHGGGQS